MTLVPPPPPPSPAVEEEEESLRFVSLSDDNRAILLNGNPDHSLSLPVDFSKKKPEEQQKIVESLIYNGCVSFNYDYKGPDNVRKHTKEVVNIFHERKRTQKAESKKEEVTLSIKKQYIQKYYDKGTGLLYEAVIVAGKPYFVIRQQLGNEPIAKLYEWILLPNAQNPTTELLPLEKEMYLSKPFEFTSEDELNKYFKLAANETPDSLYQTQKALASKYIDANDTHLTMVAADDVFTFFQDKLGQTHYLMFVGDNDTGKSTSLVYFQYEGYRAMLDVSITPANIYGFLGNFEEGQGIILEMKLMTFTKRLKR